MRRFCLEIALTTYFHENSTSFVKIPTEKNFIAVVVYTVCCMQDY